jgi:thioredoxin reductase (NADPH)
MEADRDIIVVGGGAAGLTAAQYAARANLRVSVVEELAQGGQALVIDRIENYPGFDTPISGFEFSQKLEAQARNFGAEFIQTTATALKKEGDIFTVTTQQGDLTAYAVIIATGARHRHLDIPGEKEFSGRGVSYCATCDGPFFKGKKILIIGGGDSACDDAIFLSKLSSSIVHIHRKERFRAQAALAERVLKNPNIEVRFSTVARAIQGDTKVRKVILENLTTGKRYEEEFDAVFIFIGLDPRSELVPDVKKDEGGYIITDQRMQTSLPGLFAAGDVRATPFRQIVVAAGEGAVASHCAAQYIDEIEGKAYH